MTEQNLVPGDPTQLGSDENLDATGGEGSETRMPTTTPVDADLAAENARLQTDYAKMQADMNKMRSSYDRQGQETQRQYEDRLASAAKRLDEAVMDRLEGEDRIAYELQRSKEENQSLAQQLQQERIRAEEAQQLASYQTYFSTLGLDQSGIDYTNLESMGATAFPAIEALVAELRAKPTLKSQDGPQTTPSTPGATPLLKQHGKPPVGPTTPALLVKALSDQLGYQVREEDIGKLIQSGQLDESIFDTLDPELMY